MKPADSKLFTLCVLLVCFQHVVVAQEISCRKVLEALGRGSVNAASYAFLSTHFPMVYTIEYATLRKFNPGISRRQAARDTFLKTMKYLPGAVLAALFNLAYFVEYSESEFVAATPSFDEWSDDECLVVVNFHDEKDKHRDANRRLYEKRYEGSGKCTRYIEVTSFEQMISQLAGIRSETKKPIGRLQINSHGYPGEVDLPKGEDLDRANLEKFKLNGTDIPADLMAPKAEIRLVSCRSGQGEKGEKFTEELGKILLKRGGTVWSANMVLMNHEVIESGLIFDTITTLTQVSFPVEELFGKKMAYLLLTLEDKESEFFYRLHPVRRTDIPPQLTFQ